MKKIFSNILKLTLISLLLVAWNQKEAEAQTQARATIIGIPQILPSPYISDFEQNVFAGNYQVQLNITGPGPVDVRFHVRVTLDSQVMVNETSLPSTFDSGMHILSPFPNFVQFEATTQEILENLPGDRFRQAFQSGSFPEGNYQITIEPEIVGSNMPGIEGIANFMVRFPQPPTLVSPANGASVSPTVTTPVFSWSPVMGPPGMMVEYEFLLVELFDDQNPSEAIVSNREHASAVSVGTTMLPYTASYLPLEEGKTYAWQVIARDVNGEIPINNEGRSEIHVFTYGSEDDEEEEDQVLLEEPEFTFEPVETFIPVTTISGTVQYKFRPTEGSQSNQPFNSTSGFTTSGTNHSGVQIALDDPNFSMEDAEYSGDLYTDLGNQSLDSDDGEVSLNAQVPVYGGGETGNVEIQNFSQTTGNLQQQLTEISDDLLNYPMAGASVKAVVTVNGTDRVIASTTANENGAYTLSFAPSELDRLISEGEESDSGESTSMLGQQQNQDQSISIQDADSPGSRAADMELAIGAVQIVVDSPYFEFSEEKVVTVSTKSAKTYNAGVLTGKALTYRLNPIVQDKEDDQPISDATVEIYRQEEWYDVVPALPPEGWPLTNQQEATRNLNGKTYVKVAEANASGQITRLFPRKNGSSDRYMVRVDARGYNPIVTHLSASPDLSEFESATVEKVYKLQKAPPMVEGRVVRRDNQAPIKNAIVMVQPPPPPHTQGINLYPRVAVTDSNGRFTLTNIVAYPDPYKLTVQSAKSETYEEEILLDERGLIVQRDPIMVDPTLITVVGRIQNDKSENIANATVKWQDGGSPVQTDSYGRFVTANTQGTHELQIRKIGHADLDTSITVEITEEPDFDLNLNQSRQNWTADDISNFSNTTNQWANSVMNSESFQTGEEGEDFSFASLGYSGNATSSYNIDPNFTQENTNTSFAEYSSAASYFMEMMGEGGSPGETQDIGTLVISRAVGKLDVTVESASDGSPIENATVQVGKTGPSGETDDQGNIYFDETPAGTVSLGIQAPASTNYVPILTEKTITDNGEITEVTVTMDLGGRATGTVTAAGNPVEGASVRLEGRDDITTTSDSDGNYTLPGIPTGEWTLKAGKSGFVGDSQTATFSEDGEQTLDFSVQDSEFNIASLLGFEIEVEELSVSPSDTTITGAFVSIPSNDLLSVESDFRIPFSDINVYEQNGELLPVGGSVQTDMSEFNAVLFDFLQVTISNSSGIMVRLREIPTEVGYIAGEVKIDYESTFTGATGWEWPDAADQFLELPNTDDLPEDVSDQELVTLTSDGSFPIPDVETTDFELQFGSASETIELYGFQVDLTLDESVLRNDGFHMSGDVTLSDIPVLNQSTITLQEFWIGTDGTVKEASLDLDPQPELQIANWALEVASGALSENGFSLGGSVEVNVPSSDPTEISFSDLSLSPDQIFGGQFTLPASGVDVFGIVALETKPGTDITFGKVQNEDVYFVSGAATISLPKYVDKSLEFRDFLIRSDAQFSANIAADFEADFFGLADLTVNGVEFETIGTPSIYVDGNFGLRAIPFVNAQAGGLSYQPGGNVSFDEIDLDFDIVGVANVGVGIGLIDTDTRQGFSGSGEIGIAATPLDLGIDFFYERVSGGLSFGADVQAGLPPIPIGTVTLAGIGGGFEYNTSSKEIGVTLRGTITVAPGTGAAVALDPLEVSVEAGGGNAPVIEGFAQLSVMTQQIADAELTIDFGKPFFDLEANVGFEQLDDVNIAVDGSARLVVSGEQGDSYWMVGARYNAELLELFNANANLLAAWDLNVNAHPEYDQYTDFVSSDYITGGTITGVHLDVSSEFGIPESDKKCLDFKVGKACGWFYNSTRCKLNADFQSTNMGFYLGSNWGGGGNVDFAGFDVIGASVSASGSISGSYYNNVWSANGQASADLSAYVGNCNVGCQTKVCFWGPVPDGASLCASGSIEVDYQSNRGMQISVSLDT